MQCLSAFWKNTIDVGVDEWSSRLIAAWPARMVHREAELVLE